MADSDDGVEAWGALLRVHATVVPRIARDLAATGLALSWYDVLLVLNRAPARRLSMSALGERVVVSRERVSRVVAEMEGAGLVERQPSEVDGRSVLAVLTPVGRQRLRQAAPVYLAAIEEHFTSRITAGERRAVARALGKVLADDR